MRPTTGSSALEFALVTPLLAMLTVGLLDYGWFYMQEGDVVGAVASAVRAGATLQPAKDDETGCTPCLDAVAYHAQEGLAAAGFATSGLAIAPRMEPLAGSCAIVLEVDVPHHRLLRFVPSSASHRVQVAANADFVEACP